MSGPLSCFSETAREKRFVFLLETRSPFPYWARFLVGKPRLFGPSIGPTLFSDILCQHPLNLIGSLAQFRWESHPTWMGGVLLFPHTYQAAAEVASRKSPGLENWAKKAIQMGSWKALLFSPFLLWSQRRGVRLMFLLLTLHLGNWWVNSRT